MTPGSSEPQAMHCDRCGHTLQSMHTIDTSNQELRDFLDCSFYKTLCRTCVGHLDNLIRRAADVPIDKPGTKLIEGTHYYMEGAFMVFTELYHVSKGYCCKSGCRHCAYGYKVDF